MIGIEENSNPNILQLLDSPFATSARTKATTSSSLSTGTTTGTTTATATSPDMIALLGRKLVTYTKRQILPFLPTLHVLNPVCVIYDVLDQKLVNTGAWEGKTLHSNKSFIEQGHHHHHHHHQAMFTSTAYGTLNKHLLVGEERVTVVIRPNGNVDVQVLSYSKPSSSILSRAIYPFVGNMQDAFFRSELDYIKHSYDSDNQS